MIYTVKCLCLSLGFGNRHPIILAVLVTAGIYLSTLDLWGLEYVFATAAAIYLLVLIFALYFKFLGWLSSLTETS